MHAQPLFPRLQPWILFAALCLSPLAATARSEDPAPGESWLEAMKVSEFRDHRLVHGLLRATDNYGVSRDRELRIEVRGSVERGDRELLLHRYEPDCLSLARAAAMTADEFCDQLTATRRGGELELHYLSFDANKRYGFTLVERAPGQWESLRTAVPAPALTLTLDTRDGARYAWSLVSERARYTQQGAIDADSLRRSGLDALEASLLALGDVQHSFHAEEFLRSDLPRSHALYQPTPYGLWSEGPLDTECVFIFCFGSVGGGGGTSSQGMCNPNSSNYQPQNCPADLAAARWPLSHRLRMKKLSANSLEIRFGIRNEGTGHFDGSPYANGTPIAHLSITKFDSQSPLVAPGTAPFGDEECYNEKQLANFATVDPFTQFPYMSLDAGDVALDTSFIVCHPGPHRPSGRYRAYLNVDPTGVLDSAGVQSNNVLRGLLDWVRFEN